jgi:glycosyltransferase involved in cell wall biosynthesis
MVVSSFMEGVPVVLMEAMAKELGVIATRVGGIPELVEDGVSGVLVNPGSADSLAGAIRALAADPSSCQRLGAQGRKRVLADYAIDQVGAGMVALFRKYLGEPGR